MANTQEAGPALGSVRRVESLLLRIGRKKSEFAQLSAEMEAGVAAARAPYAERLRARGETITALEAELRETCAHDKEGLLVGGDGKNLDTIYGRIGWRLNRLAVVQDRTMTSADSARLLEAAGHAELVRVTKAPDKGAILTAIQGGDLTQKALGKMGLSVAGGDEVWYYGLDEGAVEQYIAGGGQEGQEDQ